MVHCDTPTGTLNSEAVRLVGQACADTDALFYVDIVSSAGAVPVDISGWNIDIGKDNYLTCRLNCRLLLQERQRVTYKVLVLIYKYV